MTADPKRLRSIRRIADLRHQLKRIEEIKLAHLHAEEAELNAKREVLITALNDDDALHGLFVDDMAGRLKRINERQQALQPIKAFQTQRVLVQARHAKFAETMMDKVSKEVDAVQGKRELEGLIEQFLAQKPDASLP